MCTTPPGAEDQGRVAQGNGGREEVMRRLVEKYEKLLDGDSGPDALGVLEAEERREQLREQGIRPNTLTQRAGEAIERTRERYVKSFVSDGLTQGEAEARALSFISDPDR
jgi:hypothetical protein